MRRMRRTTVAVFSAALAVLVGAATAPTQEKEKEKSKKKKEKDNNADSKTKTKTDDADPTLPKAELVGNVVKAQTTAVASSRVIAPAKKPAREHKAFTLEDIRAKTGKKDLNRDSTISLKNGKEAAGGKIITVGAALDELNRIEREFNKLGYSLRDEDGEDSKEKDKKKKKKGVEQPKRGTVLVSSVPAATVLKDQQTALAAGHLKTNKTHKSRDLKTLRLEEEKIIEPAKKSAAAAGDVKIVGKQDKPQPKTVGRNWEWDKSVGDRDSFQAYINMDAGYSGTIDATSVHAEAKAGGYVFNKNVEVVRITGDVRCPAAGKGDMTADLVVRVLGLTVHQVHKRQTASLTFSDSYSKSVNFGVSVPVPIGPIPLKVTIGVEGSAGLDYLLSIVPRCATATIEPFARTSGYCEVGIDILITGFAVGGRLTFAEYEGTLTARLFLVGETFTEWLEYSHEIELLGGELYVQWWVWPAKTENNPWEWEIWDWNGFKINGVVFDHNTSSPLY